MRAGDSGTLGSDGGRDAALRSGFTPLECQSTPKLDKVTGTPPVDFLESRSEGHAPLDGGKGDIIVRETFGVPCKTATDKTKCDATLDAISHPFTSGCSVPTGYCYTDYLVYTRGDQVGDLLDAPALAKFLAPIDSLDKALFLLAKARGGCTTGYRAVDDGFEISYTTSYANCSNGDETVADVVVKIARDGTITVLDQVTTTIPHPEFRGCPVARCAHGVVYEAAPHSDDPATYLAYCAHLEGASVASFARLARELRTRSAPRPLIERVAAAAREERRHARLLRKIARERGKVVAKSPRLRMTTRSLVEIAIENAVEGAVRETWGAVIAAHQATFATDPEIREAFAAIAPDEAGHAELAADVASWLESRLAPHERAQVMLARRTAIGALVEEIASPPSASIREDLGLPSASKSLSLFTVAQRTGLIAA
jgi:rubrerythrin